MQLFEESCGEFNLRLFPGPTDKEAPLPSNNIFGYMSDEHNTTLKFCFLFIFVALF